jgi:hypothetical protein
MARVKFTEDFDYSPTSRTIIAYLAGMELTVKRDCADQAIAAGKAEEIKGSSAPESEAEDGDAALGG